MDRQGIMNGIDRIVAPRPLREDTLPSQNHFVLRNALFDTLRFNSNPKQSPIP